MDQDNLGNKSRKALSWDLSGTALRHISTFVVSIILARILEPEEFGVIGMALVFIAISQVFLDVGFTQGLVQSQKVSGKAFSSVFYVNIIISLVLALGFYLVAPYIGAFYNNEQVEDVLKWLTPIIPVAALGKVHAAKLTKEINFKALAVRDIISTIAGGIVGITAALNDFGVYALVGQQLTTATVGTILLWIGTGWTPGLQFSWQEIRSILSFSGYVFLSAFFQQIFNKIDTIFIGKVFSPAILGFYSRAESFKALVNKYTTSSLGKISFPVFSALQDDEKKFREVFIKLITMLLVGVTLLTGIVFFMSDWIIIGLLGKKWEPSVPLLQILIFTSITLPFRTLLLKALLGHGHSNLKFKIGIFNHSFTLLSLPIGYYYGIHAFAWAYVGIRIFTTIINWTITNRKLKLNLNKILFELISPVSILLIWVVIFYSRILPMPNFVFCLLFIISYLLILRSTNSKGLNMLLKEARNVILLMKARIPNLS